MERELYIIMFLPFYYLLDNTKIHIGSFTTTFEKILKFNFNEIKIKQLNLKVIFHIDRKIVKYIPLKFSKIK